MGRKRKCCCLGKSRESIDQRNDKKQNEDTADKASLPDDADKDILLDEVINRIGVGKFQVKLLFIVGIIWIADAMEIMMLAFISPALACDFNLDNRSEALLTIVVFVGMFFGSFAWGIFDDRCGRKDVSVILETD